jgi:DNA-binding LacI/PurR family transcriptional regulator
MKIAFCSDYSTPFYEAVLTALRRRLQVDPDLQLMEWEGSIRFPLAAAHYLKPDAILVGGHNVPELRDIPASTTVIGFSNAFERTPYPRVVNDDREVGRIAVRALAEAGYTKFVVFVDNELQHARMRIQGMHDVTEEMGAPLHRLNLSLRKSASNETFQDVWREHTVSLETTLKSLTPNTGIIATSALSAYEVLETLQEFGVFHIPDELGVMVADYPHANDHTLAHVALDSDGIAARIIEFLKQKVCEPDVEIPELTICPPLYVVMGSTLRLKKAGPVLL